MRRAGDHSPEGPEEATAVPPPGRKARRPPPMVLSSAAAGEASASSTAEHSPQPQAEPPNSSRENHDGAVHQDTPRFSTSPTADPSLVTPGGRKRPPGLTDGMFIPLVKTPLRGCAGLHHGGVTHPAPSPSPAGTTPASTPSRRRPPSMESGTFRTFLVGGAGAHRQAPGGASEEATGTAEGEAASQRRRPPSLDSGTYDTFLEEEVAQTPKAGGNGRRGSMEQLRSKGGSDPGISARLSHKQRENDHILYFTQWRGTESFSRAKVEAVLEDGMKVLAEGGERFSSLKEFLIAVRSGAVVQPPNGADEGLEAGGGNGSTPSPSPRAAASRAFKLGGLALGQGAGALWGGGDSGPTGGARQPEEDGDADTTSEEEDCGEAGPPLASPARNRNTWSDGDQSGQIWQEMLRKGLPDLEPLHESPSGDTRPSTSGT